MNNLQIFKNENFGQVRALENDGEIWFVSKDIAKILDYSNTRQAINTHVDEEDKGVSKCDTPGGEQEMIIINESGMYSLVLGSKMPKAKEFKRWVTSEVLPSLRKHGMYATDNTIDKILADPDFGIKLLSQLKEEREEKKKLIGKINELKPKADYVDSILRNKGLVTITQISKDYGMSGRAMNDLLHSLGVQYKQSGQWLLYAEHQGKGYTHSHTVDIERSDGQPDIIMHTKWTQKGRLFLYDLLRDVGVLPVIEQAS
jgi:anti-repressor protein